MILPFIVSSLSRFFLSSDYYSSLFVFLVSSFTTTTFFLSFNTRSFFIDFHLIDSSLSHTSSLQHSLSSWLLPFGQSFSDPSTLFFVFCFSSLVNYHLSSCSSFNNIYLVKLHSSATHFIFQLHQVPTLLWHLGLQLVGASQGAKRNICIMNGFVLFSFFQFVLNIIQTK